MGRSQHNACIRITKGAGIPNIMGRSQHNTCIRISKGCRCTDDHSEETAIHVSRLLKRAVPTITTTSLIFGGSRSGVCCQQLKWFPFIITIKGLRRSRSWMAIFTASNGTRPVHTCRFSCLLLLIIRTALANWGQSSREGPGQYIGK